MQQMPFLKTYGAKIKVAYYSFHVKTIKVCQLEYFQQLKASPELFIAAIDVNYILPSKSF